MGDGRYYTYYQFFDVAFMLILSMLAAGGIVYSYFRRTYKVNIKYTYVMFGMIAVYAIFKMIETVIPDILAAQMLRNAEAAIIILTLVHLAVMKKIYQKIRFLWIFFVFAAAVLSASLCGVFISDYVFHNVRYSDVYKMILIALLLMGCLEILRLYVENKRSGGFLRSRRFWIMNFFLLLAPMLLYTIAAVKNSRYVDYCEFLLFYCIMAVIYVDYNVSTESRLTMMAFDKIGDMSKSFIFVTDSNGKIIYKNKAARETVFFKNIQTVDLHDIAGMFAGERAQESSRLRKTYIVSVSDDRKNYFTYKNAVLKDGDNEIGCIITITEITELMELLISLEDKKEKLEAANEKLKNYSRIVYYVEKEKEINALLKEIITSRDAQMRQLCRLIQEAKGRIGDADFEQHIDAAITKSNQVLEEVRSTVTAYREYYGG